MASEIEEMNEQLELNKLKNRYLNIGAVESTRIRLHSESASDYINANYIDVSANFLFF